MASADGTIATATISSSSTMGSKASDPIIRVPFAYRGRGYKIKIDPSSSLESVLRKVATFLKIDLPIELEYRDSATGDVFVLGEDDDLQETFAAGYKWTVVLQSSLDDDAPEPSPTTPPARSPKANTVAIANKQSASFNVSAKPALHNAATSVSGNVALSSLGVQPHSPNPPSWTDLVRPDWSCKTNLQRHPFFLSYRHGPEDELATDLYALMKDAFLQDPDDTKDIQLPGSVVADVHPFLDVMCLSYGQDWEVNFMCGLYHSDVIILLCSDSSMERLKFAHQRPDNMLLEWELALQRREESACDILPILVGARQRQVAGKQPPQPVTRFKTFDFTMFPDEPHKHPRSPNQQTVRGTIEKIFRLHAPHVDPEADKEGIVASAREVRSRRRRDLKSCSALPQIFLPWETLSKLEDWLNPLSKQMKVEQDSLLKNFLPGTRQWLLKKVFASLDQDDSTDHHPNRVIMLQGAAGVGKSIMAAVICRELRAQSLLGGMFFCKHDDDQRNSARNVIVTLVYSLARFSIHFGNLLYTIYKNNPDILMRPISEMFTVLIEKPLSELLLSKTLDQPVVLVIDAIDECERYGQRTEILQVFRSINTTLPPQVRLIITGRPEEDIKLALDKLPTVAIEPSSQDNYTDQIIYATHFLTSQQWDFDAVVSGANLLVEKSGGVFVWLVTACKYLESLSLGCISRNDIEKLPDGGKLDGSIDEMYTQSFERLFSENIIAKPLQNVLATIAVVYEPLSAAGIAALLSDVASREDVFKAIRMLEPFLILDTSTRKIRLFHKSVKDYLVDPSRCRDHRFQVRASEAHARVAEWCIAVLMRNLGFNMCRLPLSALHKDIPDFAGKVNKDIPEFLTYAAKHFWEHCRDAATVPPSSHRRRLSVTLPSRERSISPSSISVIAADKRGSRIPKHLEAILRDFFAAKLHHLLELFSLLQLMPLVIRAMLALDSVISDDGQIYTVDGPMKLKTLLQDVKRVVQKFQTPLWESALQVYFTAIPFAPTSSAFRKLFLNRPVPADVAIPLVVNGLASNWSSCVNILEGHTAVVWSASFSPDGWLIVSAGADETVRIWDSATGQELRTLVGHTSVVNSAVFSSDSQRIVTSSHDESVRVWDVATGQEIRHIVHSGRVEAAALSPDDTLVASAMRDGTVIVWEADAGEELFDLQGHKSAVRSVAFSPDGSLLASGSSDNTIKIWNLARQQEERTMRGHLWEVTCVSFSPDGTQVVSASGDNTVRIWNVATGEEVRKLAGKEWMHSAAFSPNGRFVATASSDGAVAVWDAATGHLVQKLLGHSGKIKTAAFSPNGSLIVSGGLDKTLRLWDATARNDDDPPATSGGSGSGHTALVICATLSLDAQLIVSGSFDGTARLWDGSTGRELRVLAGHPAPVSAVAFSFDGRRVATGCWDGKVRVFDVATGAQTHAVRGRSGSTSGGVIGGGGGSNISSSSGIVVNAVGFSPDGRRVVVATGNTADVWELQEDTAVAAGGGSSSLAGSVHVTTLAGHTDAVHVAAFSPDGCVIVTGGFDDTTRVWDAATGCAVQRINDFSFDTALPMCSHAGGGERRVAPVRSRLVVEPPGGGGGGREDDDSGRGGSEASFTEGQADEDTAAATPAVDGVDDSGGATVVAAAATVMAEVVAADAMTEEEVVTGYVDVETGEAVGFADMIQAWRESAPDRSRPQTQTRTQTDWVLLGGGRGTREAAAGGGGGGGGGGGNVAESQKDHDHDAPTQPSGVRFWVSPDRRGDRYMSTDRTYFTIGWGVALCVVLS